MKKIILFLICVGSLSFQTDTSVIREHVTIKVYPYESKGQMKASAMPEIKPESELTSYKRRFEYLLINVPEIHLPEKAERRSEIWKLYPDTTELKRLYLNEYVQDERLVSYFEETLAPMVNPNIQVQLTFSINELMEVASKFFYCDKVRADTSVQAHVCIGLNGIKEANWDKDFTLLEAFCYEGIFNDFDKEDSQIRESFGNEKKEASEKLKPEITNLDDYLENVKTDLFERMENNDTLKQELVAYYELNKENLAFRIEN